MMTDKQDPVWYQKGLPFKCTQCGQCCTGSPGYVWVQENEIEEMAACLNITKEQFIRKYTRRIGNNLSLLEHPKNYDCVFLEGKKCKVYAARPKQCRTFPWWPEHLSSPDAWEEAAQRCEGINHPDGEIVPLGEIKKHLS
jgi:uncharacterized protein